jgi:hypothetical protein
MAVVKSPSKDDTVVRAENLFGRPYQTLPWYFATDAPAFTTAASSRRQVFANRASFFLQIESPPYLSILTKERAAHGGILHKRHHQQHWLTGLEQQLEGQEQDREASGCHAQDSKDQRTKVYFVKRADSAVSMVVAPL